MERDLIAFVNVYYESKVSDLFSHMLSTGTFETPFYSIFK